VQSLAGFNLPPQPIDAATGQHGDPILLTLTTANHQMTIVKANILHTQATAFLVAQASTISRRLYVFAHNNLRIILT
jgi:ABC-type nitrate/sulfonate/bicarbonate transport system substrate-binding protein